jgi:hypothetical protein
MYALAFVDSAKSNWDTIATCLLLTRCAAVGGEPIEHPGNQVGARKDECSDEREIRWK